MTLVTKIWFASLMGNLLGALGSMITLIIFLSYIPKSSRDKFNAQSHFFSGARDIMVHDVNKLVMVQQ